MCEIVDLAAVRAARAGLPPEGTPNFPWDLPLETLLASAESLKHESQALRDAGDDPGAERAASQAFRYSLRAAQLA